MSSARDGRPPRIAAWLVKLVSPYRQAEAISGDLAEEFSERITKSGFGSAKAWYWRQSLKTAAHLIACGFRDAPWEIAGVVVAGYSLVMLGAGLPERGIEAIIDFRRHDVVPYYTWPQAQTYLYWLMIASWIGRFLWMAGVGCVMAMVAKGKEIVSTMALSLVYAQFSAVGLLRWTIHPQTRFSWIPVVAMCLNPLSVALGGVMVRTFRSSRRAVAGYP